MRGYIGGCIVLEQLQPLDMDASTRVGMGIRSKAKKLERFKGSVLRQAQVDSGNPAAELETPGVAGAATKRTPFTAPS